MGSTTSVGRRAGFDGAWSCSMSYSARPEFSALYSLFTSDADSIAAHLNSVRARHSADEPMLVATGSDVIVFPGSGRAPVTESLSN